MVKEETKDKKSKKKQLKKVEKKKKDNYIKSVKSEISKVKWPEGKEVLKYALATLFVCVFIGLFFQLIEFLSSLLKGLL